MAHPIQACLSLGSTTVLGSANVLTAFTSSSHAPTGTSSHHSKLIRYLAAFTSPSLGPVVVSTGEDKLLALHSLPSLALLGSFELNKRANAISISTDERIVVGDKFGDVYEYPLDLRSITDEQKKAGPILGHVSMLTALALVPAGVGQKALVVSGDRDEHIRLSSFPRGYNIERFLFGSTKFIGALAYVPKSDSNPAAIISGGGDSFLSTFDLLTGKRLSKVEIEPLLLPRVIVAPLPPAPIKAGKKKGARRTPKGTPPNPSSKTVEGEEAVEVAEEGEDLDPMGENDVEPEEGEELDGDEGEIREEGEEAFVKREHGMHAWKDGVATGLAVSGLKVVEGGVLVLAAGCAALTFVPTSLLFPSATAPTSATPSTLDLLHPILDLTLQSPTEFLVALDISRGPKPAAGPALRSVKVVGGGLEVVEVAEEGQWAEKGAVAYSSTVEKPTIESLYPLLSIMHHPDSGPSFDGADESSAGMSKKERKAAAKAAADAEGSEAAEGGEGAETRRNGKRAAGRALIQARLEEAKRVKMAKESAAPAEEIA